VVNEMAFWAWAGGHVGRFNPCVKDRGPELNRQLGPVDIEGFRG
jgi:hypothetical protein